MERVQSNGTWSLFCPNEAPGLADCWGEEFETLYTRYEAEVSVTLSLKITIGFSKLRGLGRSVSAGRLPVCVSSSGYMLTSVHCAAGKGQEGSAGSETVVCGARGTNRDWQSIYSVQGAHCIFGLISQPCFQCCFYLFCESR